MKIPNAANAVVDIRKLRDYCLNPEHPRGKHKARVFKSALGLTARDANLLQKNLLDAVQIEEVESRRTDVYGERYVLDFEMSSAGGQAVIRSAWIIRSSEEFPRLISCFVL